MYFRGLGINLGHLVIILQFLKNGGRFDDVITPLGYLNSWKIVILRVFKCSAFISTINVRVGLFFYPFYLN